MKKLVKRNVWRELVKAEMGCAITINRWLLARAAAICRDCGVKLKIDDDTIDYETDDVLAIVAADSEENYLMAAQDMHNILGIDLSPR